MTVDHKKVDLFRKHTIDRPGLQARLFSSPFSKKKSKITEKNDEKSRNRSKAITASISNTAHEYLAGDTLTEAFQLSFDRLRVQLIKAFRTFLRPTPHRCTQPLASSPLQHGESDSTSPERLSAHLVGRWNRTLVRDDMDCAAGNSFNTSQ